MNLSNTTPARTILIADDDPDLLSLLEQRCQSIGLQTLIANNASQAWSLIENNLPDLVILDVHMPKGNGLSVAEMMSNHDRLQETPVIILSGVSDQEMLKRCHSLQAYFIPKFNDAWENIRELLEVLLNIPKSTQQPVNHKLSYSVEA